LSLLPQRVQIPKAFIQPMHESAYDFALGAGTD